MIIGLHVCIRYSCQILMRHFLHRFSTNMEICNFMKIHPVGAELFHVDGQTDRLRERER